MNWTFSSAGALLSILSTISLVQPAAGADGQSLYNKHCADCHHMTLKGTGHGPELTGPNFESRWKEGSLTELYGLVRTTMPPGKTDALRDEEYEALFSYMLTASGLQPSIEEAPPALQEENAEETKADDNGDWQSWSAPDAIDTPGARKSGFANKVVENFNPVSNATLANPPDGDWLSWRRTLDGEGHSPLTQVNRDTVGTLQLAWVFTMNEGSNQGTPLVHDGIMYLTHPRGMLFKP